MVKSVGVFLGKPCYLGEDDLEGGFAEVRRDSCTKLGFTLGHEAEKRIELLEPPLHIGRDPTIKDRSQLLRHSSGFTFHGMLLLEIKPSFKTFT